MSLFFRLFTKGNPFMSIQNVQDVPKAVPAGTLQVPVSILTASQIAALATTAAASLDTTALAALTTVTAAAPTTAGVAAMASTAAPAMSATAGAGPAKGGARPIDQIHADIVAAQAQHTQLRAQAQGLSATVTGLKKTQTATADRLRALRAELQGATSAIASGVEKDIAEVESFFQRLVKEL